MGAHILNISDHPQPSRTIRNQATMQLSLALAVLVTVVACFTGSDAGPGKAGGLSTVSKNDPQVKIAANFAVSEMGSDYSLNRIKKAQTQVVAGTMYHLTLSVTRAKMGDSDLTFSCVSKVLDRGGWKSLSEFHCTA